MPASSRTPQCSTMRPSSAKRIRCICSTSNGSPVPGNPNVSPVWTALMRVYAATRSPSATVVISRYRSEAHQVHLLHVERLARAGEPERVTGVDGAHARVCGHEIALGDRRDQPVQI